MEIRAHTQRFGHNNIISLSLVSYVHDNEGNCRVSIPTNPGADPENFLRGGPESKFCKMKGIHSNNVQHQKFAKEGLV